MVTQVVTLMCNNCGNSFDTTQTYDEFGQRSTFTQKYCDYCDYDKTYGKAKPIPKVVLEQIDKSVENFKDNTPEDDEDYENPYCEVCESCGEEGCCSVEKSLLGHNCKYGEYYAKEVYYNEMLIDELLKLLESNGVGRDETGDVVIDPIGDAYDRAYKRVKEKYDDC